MRYKKDLPSIKYLNECFNANFETGELKWKERPIYHFKDIHAQISFNNRFSNTLAGNLNKINNYINLCIDHKMYPYHRIIWKMYYNSIDNYLYVDHINGNQSDNRIENLRLVTASINNRNQKINKNNKSGIKGVWWDNKRRKWVVLIRINNYQKKFLGRFKDKEDAIEARKKAELEYGYLNTH